MNQDEPLRTEYSPYAAYGYPDLVNPYAHHAMSRWSPQQSPRHPSDQHHDHHCDHHHSNQPPWPSLPLPTQLKVSTLDCKRGKRKKHDNDNVDNVDNDNNDCRREKRKKQDSLPGGNSLTRDERKVRRPEPFFAWRGFSILICLLVFILICGLSFFWTAGFLDRDLFADYLGDADRSSFHPDMHGLFFSFHCIQRVSMTPALWSDEDSVNSYIRWWFKYCFCPPFLKFCMSVHLGIVFVRLGTGARPSDTL